MHHRAPLAHACLALALTGTLLGCQNHPRVDRSPVLATVNGERITLRDYRDYVHTRDRQEPALSHGHQSRRTILKELINRVLLSQAAVHAGLLQKPDVAVALKENRENILARAMLNGFLLAHPVSMKRLRALYEQRVLKGPHVEFEARHILVATKAQADKIITALHHGARFSALARADSLDVFSGRRGGQLGWFSAGDILPTFYNAVSHLRVGEISPTPVKTRFGWHVIQLEAKRPYTPPPFAAVKERLYRHMEEQRVDAMMALLRTKAHIHLSPQALLRHASRRSSKQKP